MVMKCSDHNHIIIFLFFETLCLHIIHFLKFLSLLVHLLSFCACRLIHLILYFPLSTVFLILCWGVKLNHVPSEYRVEPILQKKVIP